MLNIHEINGGKYVSMLELYNGLGLAKAAYSKWVKNNLLSYFAENEDFVQAQPTVEFVTRSQSRKKKTYKSTQDYLLTITCAKEIAMMAKTENSRAYRQWLIGLEDKVESGELMTAEEAVIAIRLVDAFKFVENQKAIYDQHKKHYIDNLVESELIKKNPYVLFERYRNDLIGYDKKMVEHWIDEYCREKYDYPIRLKREQEINKLPKYKQVAIVNSSEAIKSAIMDYLYSNEIENGRDRIMKVVSNMIKKTSVKTTSDNPMEEPLQRIPKKDIIANQLKP